MHPSLSQPVAYTEFTEIKRDYINTIQHSLPLREQPLNSTGVMSACVRSDDILSIWDLNHNMDTGQTWSLGEGKMQFASRLGWSPPTAGTPSPDHKVCHRSHCEVHADDKGPKSGGNFLPVALKALHGGAGDLPVLVTVLAPLKEVRPEESSPGSVSAVVTQ